MHVHVRGGRQSVHVRAESTGSAHPDSSIPWVRVWFPRPHCPNTRHVYTVWGTHTGDTTLIRPTLGCKRGRWREKHFDQKSKNTRSRTNTAHVPQIPVAPAYSADSPLPIVREPGPPCGPSRAGTECPSY